MLKVVVSPKGSAVKFILKLFFLLLAILCYILTATSIRLFCPRGVDKRILSTMKFYCVLAVRILGIRVVLKNTPKGPWMNQGPRLIVANHMSYLDILAVNSLFPAVNITSIEMKESSFIGLISKLAITIFIERRNRNNIQQELSTVRKHLLQNHQLALYPEGTSTDGSQILKFKRSFFDPAIDTKTPILPLCLRYESIDGEPFSPKNADRVCWYGKMDFFPHLMGILRTREVVLNIYALPEIAITPHHDRRSLADECYHQISEQYSLHSQ